MEILLLILAGLVATLIQVFWKRDKAGRTMTPVVDTHADCAHCLAIRGAQRGKI